MTVKQNGEKVPILLVIVQVSRDQKHMMLNRFTIELKQLIEKCVKNNVTTVRFLNIRKANVKLCTFRCVKYGDTHLSRECKIDKLHQPNVPFVVGITRSVVETVKKTISEHADDSARTCTIN